jgi:hypothetical protein
MPGAWSKRGSVACVALVFWAGCWFRAPTTAPEPTAAVDVPSDALPATNRETGESLELTIPVLDGDPTPLTALRGQVVLLELTATWAEGFGANESAYEQLLQEYPEQTQIIVVGMDPERSALDARWSGVAPQGLWRAWDPQGALAAQLQAAKLPTLIVVDRDGVIARVWGGYTPDQWEQVAEVVATAL